MNYQETFRNSLFSSLSYAEWDVFNSQSEGNIASFAQEQFIASAALVRAKLGAASGSPWTIPSFHPSDATGFAANVFANGDQKVLAIRGTEPNDTQVYLDAIQADLLEMGLIGMSLSQATSMFNYVQRLRAPSGDNSVLQLELRVTESAPADLPSITTTLLKGREDTVDRKVVHYWFQPRYTGRGEGVLQASDQITVTGHSLGGHLAALALRLFPGVFQDAVIFNTANFDPAIAQFIPGGLIELLEGLAPNSPIKPFVSDGFTNAQQLTERLINSLFAAYLPGAAPATSFSQVAARLFNYVSEDSAPADDVALVAGRASGRAPAPVRALRTETNSHSMDQIMDSLAVYALLEKLNPTLQGGQIEALIDAASNQPESSLEHLVGALDKAFHQHDASLAPVAAGIIGYPSESDVPGTFNRRSAIHARILAIEGTASAQPQRVLESLVGVSVSELVERAEIAAAYRYALVELNPFVLQGEEALYADQPALARERFSPDYLADRAAYLEAEIRRRQNDQANEVHGPLPFKVQDLARDDTLQITAVEVHPFGAAVNRMPTRSVWFGSDDKDMQPGSGLRDHLYGEAGDDDLFGQDSADVLDGGIGHDRLQGGTGRDTLWGGEGDDWLYGGTLANPEDMAADDLQGGAGIDHYLAGSGDRIRDRDGELSVVLEGNIYRASGQALRTHFKSDALSLYQSVALPALWYLHTPATRTLRVAGVVIDDFEEGVLGITLQGADAPIPERALQTGTAEDDRLHGTAGRDLVRALAGEDQVYGHEEDDLIFGGEGSDHLVGDAGADELYGEAGRDGLFGEDGNDILDGGTGADVLSGNRDNDVLMGGPDAGNDLLFGGSGHDVLLGGPGNDFLSGSGAVSGALKTWSLEFLRHPMAGTVRDPRNLRLRGISVSNAGELFAPRDTDGDVLYGEGGNDYLLGSAGDDTLDGGADDDVIAGADGADHLFGGSGVDHLRGGGGADVIEGGDDADVIVGHGGDESNQPDGDDLLRGGAGDDRLHGGPGADRLQGDAGADVLYGDDGMDALEGGEGADELLGGTENDELDGGAGSDVLLGEDGNDGLLGGGGDDVLLGGAGDDALLGDADHDQLQGGEGSDALFGGAGDDVLQGGSHNDVLSGDLGADLLYGESGNDLYLYRPGDGMDEILDPSGDNGLWLLGHPELTAIQMTEFGADLMVHLGDAQQVRIRSWREEGGIDYLRFGERGYLSRANFLQPALAGQLWTFTNETAAPVGSAGDDLVMITATRGKVNAGIGNDRYVIAASEEIEVQDAQGANTLQFAPGVRLQDLAVTARDGRYVLSTGAATIVVTPGHIARFVFDDGLVLSAAEFDARYAQLVDPAPRVLHPASVQAGFVATPFRYSLPLGQFIDLFPGEVLSEAVSGSNGTVLPAWLSYDVETRTFTGTPSAAGTFEIDITVHDLRGQAAVDRFAIDVLPTLGVNAVAIFEPALLPTNLGSWVARFGRHTQSPYLMGVGDLNADSIDDVFEPDAGRIVFGRREGFGVDYTRPNLNGYNGFSLSNYAAADLAPEAFGFVSYTPTRGDFNQDGVADVKLGTRILLGQRGLYAPVVDYAQLPLAERFSLPAPGSSLPLLRTASGEGIDPSIFRALGDFNGDQREDYFGVLDEGRGWVIYGVADRAAVLDIDHLGGDRGFAIDFLPYPGLPGYRAEQALLYASWGTNVIALGDLNGDALADFAIGSSPYLFEEQAAFVALVFGTREIRHSPLALSDFNGINGLLAAIPGVTAGVGAPKFAVALGDVNGDGFADALIGSPIEPVGSYIIYGRENFGTAATYHTPGDDIIHVPDTETGPVFAGAGHDRLFIGRSSIGSTTFLGSGNDVISFKAERGRHRTAGGPGNDRYEVAGREPSGLYELHIEDERGHNTLYLNASAGGSIWIRKGSVALDFGAEFPVIHLENVDYDNVLGGPRTIDTIEFQDGTRWSYETLIARGFDIDGTAFNDDLTGTNVRDRINGGNGDDRLAGGQGDDSLRGGAGNDLYAIDFGSGVDLVQDDSGSDVIHWGAGIAVEDLHYASDGEALIITMPEQSVRIEGWYRGLSSRIEQFRFADGQTLDALTLINSAPVAALALTPATAREGSPFSFTLPAALFTDPDPFEQLHVTMRDTLPTWLTFDAASGTLRGTPGASDVGAITLNFLAHDLVGATAQAALSLNVSALPINRPTPGSDWLVGTAGPDRIAALAGDDTVRGEAGNDLLYGDGGHDTLDGGPGNDKLFGGVGNDRLSGGTGDDLLVGGPGNDVYRFERGTGRDRILEFSRRDYDVVEFGAGLAARDLTFKRVFGGFQVGIRGTQDTLNIGFEFASFGPAIDEYRFVDGTRLLAQEVNQLAQAMAGFSPTTFASGSIRRSDVASMWPVQPLTIASTPLFAGNA